MLKFKIKLPDYNITEQSLNMFLMNLRVFIIMYWNLNKYFVGN
jgi:hypothetical protein